MNETNSSDSERTLKADERNGVYLLTIQKAYEGYVVMSEYGQQAVESVKINGNKYFGVDERAEIECDDFEITESGALNLRYHDTDSDQ